MKSNLAKKQLTMVTLVLALTLAVYLNWRFANTDSNALLVTDVLTSGSTVTDEAGTDGDKYYGEALFVSTDGDSATYFEEARLNRTRTRDEALETLQKALQDTDLTQAEKEAIMASLAAEAKNITIESNIETLIKGKGFADCVVFINGDRVKVMVSAGSEGLTPSQVSQIKECVLSACDVPVQNITIVEVK